MVAKGCWETAFIHNGTTHTEKVIAIKLSNLRPISGAMVIPCSLTFCGLWDALSKTRDSSFLCPAPCGWKRTGNLQV